MVVSNPVSYDPRVLNEARSLVDHGHRVTVLGWDREGQFPARERMDGVDILRVRNTPWMWLLRWDLLRLRPWWRLAYRRALALHAESRIDVVHCHDLDTLPTGVWLKKKGRFPLVYDAHEIWGYMVARDLPRVLANHYLRKERRLIRSVDAVITVNEPLKAYFEAIGSVPVAVMMNAKPVRWTEYAPPENDQTFTAIHIGTLNESRLIQGLVDAVQGLSGVRLVLGGIGKPAYLDDVREHVARVANAEFLGTVPQEDVLPLTRQANVVICLTDPTDKNNAIATANKQFEAMASGRPILVSRGTYPGEFTERHGVGLAIEHSVEGVQEGIRRLKDEPSLAERLGRQALRQALSEFNWDRQEEKLLEVYGGLPDGTDRRGLETSQGH